VTAPVKKRIAIVGVGYWGPNWIRTILSSPVADLAVVCDNNSRRLEYVQTTFPGVAVSDDFESVIARDDVDALIIATPPETHEQLGIKAFEAGKHVLMEKPLALTVEAAQNLLSASQAHKRILAVGHVFAYNPAVTAMNNALRSNEIGKLLYANSSRMNLPPPNARHSVIWDLAVHDVSISLTVNPAMPISVMATAGKLRHHSLFDAATVTIEFEDGTMAWHHVGWLSAERVRKYFAGCENGAMEFDDTITEGKLKLFGAGIDTRLDGGNSSATNLAYSAGEIILPQLDETSPLEVELQQFIVAIKGGPPPVADGNQGLLTVRILAAADDSASNNGKSVSLLNHEI
jgi:predicted dehydrogenase